MRDKWDELLKGEEGIKNIIKNIYKKFENLKNIKNLIFLKTINKYHVAKVFTSF